MRNFFGTIGKNFVGWEGWRDMGDFFANIGKGFVSKYLEAVRGCQAKCKV